ncbi:LLM class flavin-dependent oxidoreductase [Micromonospora sp. NBC_01699]|uniref:LLM class flavin-dependent oxidoreductase n=1 Tax=Micromonospora sp. NBC_01699 TaxID=2975984 RepID=UPI002E2C4A5C|nr:LLM class flavin-dependent oxidoreductase [Micromonospora sp. NBC_01699]
MELGILSLSDLQISLDTGRKVTAGQRIDDTVDYAVLGERLGLDVFALGEHHSLDFAVSSPAVVLAAIAACTEKIRLTSAVTVLSALDPVRVYQDYATLDLVLLARRHRVRRRSSEDARVREAVERALRDQEPGVR